MNSATEVCTRRAESIDFGGKFQLSNITDAQDNSVVLHGNSNGITVYFRLVSYSGSEGVPSLHDEHMNPLVTSSIPSQASLSTPYVSPPVQSPVNTCQSQKQQPIGVSDRLLYPLPPSSSLSQAPQTASMYYTPQSVPSGMYHRAGGYYPPPTHFGMPEEINQHGHQISTKQRAMSAEVHHSPSFNFVGSSHRSSFCLPAAVEKTRTESLALVSEQMLLSAMPDRYDD